MVVMLIAGYLAPAVAGVGAALLLAAGHALGLLWLLVGWLAVMLVQIRNLYGFAVLVGCGAAVALASWYPAGAVVVDDRLPDHLGAADRLAAAGAGADPAPAPGRGCDTPMSTSWPD